LVLLGDHGMNDAGNHGASSPGEVSTALTFISPKFKSAFEGQPGPLVSVADFKYYNVVQQSDIVPTLAALLGFPIPRNNLGVIIPRLLELWTVEEDQYHLLYENAEQISRIARATFASDLFDDDEQDLVWDDCSTKGDDVEILACLWKAISRDHKTHLQGGATKTSSRMARLQTFLHHSQTLLSGTASNYELASMKLGIGLSALALALCLPAFSTGLLRSGGADGVVLVCIMLTYAVTMFASSYVEEEHQFWYWILGGWLVVLFCKDGRYKTGTNSTLVSGQTGTALVFFLLGVVRRWRQTGQKYAGEPDLLSQVVTPDAWLLWTLVGLTYGALSRDLSRRAVAWTGSRQMGVLPVLVCGSGFLFKLAFTAADAPELLHRFSPLGPLVSFVAGYPLVGLARVVFLGLAHLLGCSIYYEAPWQGARHLQSFLAAFQDVLSLLLITQSRTVFVPLFLLFGLQLRLLRRGRNHGVVEIAILALLFQYAAFFAAGGTNSIATVDLSNAYNGVGGYNVAAVGALTFVSNWAGPIWWAFAVGQLFSSTQLTMGACSFLLTALMTFACIHALAVMVACMVLREHLFIWTVFSPKYLYTAAWIVGQHTVVNALGVGLLLWRH
jgi:ethanolaminephosphotransferase